MSCHEDLMRAHTLHTTLAWQRLEHLTWLGHPHRLHHLGKPPGKAQGTKQKQLRPLPLGSCTLWGKSDPDPDCCKARHWEEAAWPM